LGHPKEEIEEAGRWENLGVEASSPRHEKRVHRGSICKQEEPGGAKTAVRTRVRVMNRGKMGPDAQSGSRQACSPAAWILFISIYFSQLR